MVIEDYTGRCGNCHAPFLTRGDKFCHVCGTRKGQGNYKPFEPYQIWSCDTQTVRFYRCPECDHEWHTNSFNPEEKDSYFCPACGESNVLLEDSFVS